MKKQKLLPERTIQNQAFYKHSNTLTFIIVKNNYVSKMLIFDLRKKLKKI